MDGGRQQQQEEEENGMMDQESEACEMTIDGASEDEILKHANALTREEVVRRRARRVRQLIKLYRVQYWSLLEEMRSKYRLFYLRSGKSGWRDDGEEKEGEDLREPHAPDKSSGDNIKCGVQGCKAKPLPLSVFCFSHILLEPKQQLYKPCTYLIRSGQTGNVTCGRPVLQAVTPCLCGVHFQHAQKQAARALKKTNSNLPSSLGGLAAKTPPKLHIVISGYVRLIQTKRRALSDQGVLTVPVCKEEVE